jgi:hypothetical protein
MTFKNKIVILICYYGNFPWYFSYFLHSCKFNPTIDFLIFSDIKDYFDLPKNLKIVNKSIADIKKLVVERVGVAANIDHPYKLCDFKPSYGLIFEDYIKKYDFWGQSDLDIIYGNIRWFMTDEFLDSYDFISVRHDYTTGCFALYRNNARMNTIFMRSRDYKRVFSSPDHFCFDECNFAWDKLTAGASIFDLKTEIESFTHIIKAAERDGEVRAHFDFIIMEGNTGRLIFDNGRVVYKGQFEAMLFHLFWLKKLYQPKHLPKKIPDKYYISKTRIYHRQYEATHETLPILPPA